MNTKILFNELIFNNFGKIFNKQLINLIINIYVNTWKPWFNPVMCHPRNITHSIKDNFLVLLHHWPTLSANWSKISKCPPPLHTSDIALFLCPKSREFVFVHVKNRNLKCKLSKIYRACIQLIFCLVFFFPTCTTV